MKLNEVFTPISEEAYQTKNEKIEEVYERYRSILEPMVKEHRLIFRGMKTIYGDYAIGDGANLNRQSANTTNFYTLITDNDPTWSNFPKRSKSFICTTSMDHAYGYGSVYVVVPLENQPIGVCSSKDFWFSFGDGKADDIKSPKHMNEMLEHLGDFYHPISDYNYRNFRDDMDKVSEMILADPHHYAVTSLSRDYGFKPGDSLYDLYVNFINPKKNGFKIARSVFDLPHDKLEVWLSGKVLFLKYYDLLKYFGGTEQ